MAAVVAGRLAALWGIAAAAFVVTVMRLVRRSGEK
jgi:hypothetical protein